MAHAKIEQVAFIGTGIMGAPIAGHILDAGYSLTVYNRTKDKAQELIDRGATWASSPAEAASKADVVFTMLGYPTDVEDVYLASDGLLKAAKKGAWLVDLTTSAPSLARDIHDAAEVLGMHAFDCPVTGGQAGAKAGTLTAIAGISEADAVAVAPVLATFTSKIFYFGSSGKGQTAKLCNQVSLASCMVGMADALALAQQSGLDVQQMLHMVGSGMGSSRALTELGPKAVEGDYRPGFLNEHMRKDISLALAEGQDMDLALPGAQTAYTLYDLLCQIKGARLGTQALALLYAEEADAVAAGLDWSVLDIEEEDEPEADHECSCDHKHTHEHCHNHTHGTHCHHHQH
ncbi:NAD(P)-dependent oxidoreductase [Atopobium fossor]|uniref:NAD(P)-dependent oxidoreductase n=1 Tax=Atopobium fossor TaxID=39487 RepID=UPI0003F908DE|nr:NAD(P)-dependent oxidoreductase [Atopobium fossor]